MGQCNSIIIHGRFYFFFFTLSSNSKKNKHGTSMLYLAQHKPAKLGSMDQRLRRDGDWMRVCVCAFFIMKPNIPQNFAKCFIAQPSRCLFFCSEEEQKPRVAREIIMKILFLTRKTLFLRKIL